MERIAAVYSAEMREKVLVDPHSGGERTSDCTRCDGWKKKKIQKAPTTCMNLTVSDCDLVAVGTS